MSDLPDYTPGPWRYEKYDGNHESAIIGGCYQIATVYYDDAGSNANARLIAAAPDLLAACKAAVAQGRHAHYCGWKESDGAFSRGVLANSCNCYLALCRAVITKAEGVT